MSDEPTQPRRTAAQRIGFWLGLVGFVGMLVWSAIDVLPQPLGTPAFRTLAVAWLMACWWVTEAVPIPATSLVPLFALPVLGILDVKAVAPAYAHRFILLMMAGFMLALAIEAHGLHRRIALALLARTGTSPIGVMAVFMLVTMGLSMWISNTATTLIMLPIALAVVAQTASQLGGEDPRTKRFGLGLLLAIAYSANVGGIGTPVGTPPNLILMGVYAEQFPGQEVTFSQWLVWGIPFVVVFVPFIAAYLYFFVMRPERGFRVADSSGLKAQLDDLGPMRPPEIIVAVVFVLTALAWVFRRGFDVFGVKILGWQELLGLPNTIDDSTVAVAAALLLFALPRGDGKGQMLTWDIAKKLPWGLLLLFGGGIALANGFGESGLSKSVGEALASLADWPLVLLVLAIALTVTFLTEITSNTATTTLLMPILAAVAIETNIEPLVLLVPAAMSASCAFMLPVATAPNAIVFGTGRIAIAEMARAGFWVNLAGAFLVTAIVMIAV